MNYQALLFALVSMMAVDAGMVQNNNAAPASSYMATQTNTLVSSAYAQASSAHMERSSDRAVAAQSASQYMATQTDSLLSQRYDHATSMAQSVSDYRATQTGAPVSPMIAANRAEYSTSASTTAGAAIKNWFSSVGNNLRPSATSTIYNGATASSSSGFGSGMKNWFASVQNNMQASSTSTITIASTSTVVSQ